MTRVSLSVKHARALWGLLPNISDVSPEESRAMAELSRQLAPRPKSSAAKRTEKRRRTKREETSAIYEQVAKRAGWWCENCNRTLDALNPGEMDHQLGRRVPQSIENCWMLCRTCHRAKTENRPDAEYWLRAIASHAHRHGHYRTGAEVRRRLDGIVGLREATR
jgi:hypothetical protein